MTLKSGTRAGIKNPLYDEDNRKRKELKYSMKKNKKLPLAEKKHANFRTWKKGKLWLYGCATLLALTGLVAVGTQTNLLSAFTQTSVVSADTITDNRGTTIGTVSGKPVIKTSNNDMLNCRLGRGNSLKM